MKRSIYFIGIGGIGMSALARYFKAQGVAVSGSDSIKSAITDSLLKDAIKVKIGHKRANLAASGAHRPDLIIYNRAIRFDNAELREAARLGIPTLPYAKVVGIITKEYFTIAITGSHGKSTTTALAGLALEHAGLDPTVLIGTNLKEFAGKNIRLGRGRYLVLEADDFGAAFLEYSPAISIVTNIDKEHMDFYKTFAGVKNAFLKFIAKTREGGILILNRDDRVLFGLRGKIAMTAKKKRLRVVWYSTKNSTGAKRNAIKIKKVIKIPGGHNLSNAMSIYELGTLLMIPKQKTLRAIARYEGAWRRMEYRGNFSSEKDTLIYDDYAHHPTEIKATLKAFKEKFVKFPVICIFQPHQTKRLQALFKEFTSAFTDADMLILIPSYKVPGRDEEKTKFTSERLAHAIVKKYPDKKVFYLANPKRLKLVLKKLISSPSVVVMMGAGDIVQYTDTLL